MAPTLLSRLFLVAMSAVVSAGCGQAPDTVAPGASSIAVSVSTQIPIATAVDTATALDRTGMVLPTSATVLGSGHLDQPADLYTVVLIVAETQAERMLAESGFVKPLELGRPSTLPTVAGFAVPSGPQVSSLQEAFTQTMFREILLGPAVDGVVRVHVWSWRER